VIPRIGGAGMPGFFNDQGVEALNDADAILFIVVPIPILSLPAQAALMALLSLLGVAVRRRARRPAA
jgi:hypothetical protein